MRDAAQSLLPGVGRLAAGLVGAAAALTLVVSSPAYGATPFLKSTGARGPLAEEEEQLYKLRQMYEGEVREELSQARAEFEEETKASKLASNQLCATPFGIDVVGITEFVALTGALVGGISARRRKEELERLNEQLRTINQQLRQQARAGTIYAPGLTYAPPSMGGSGFPALNGIASPAGGIETLQVTLPKVTLPVAPATEPPQPDAAEKAAPAPASAASSSPAPAVSVLSSLDEDEERPEVKQCQAALKEGKRLLKDQQAGPSMVRFEKALMLAKAMSDKVRERRAVRGLAAASRLTGQGRAAIKHLERVLEISKDLDDYVGDADAYGTIADIYADIGEFDRAAEYYDKYIERMGTDGPV